MTAQMYATAKKSFLDGDIDLLNDDIRAILLDTGADAFNAADDFLDDIAAGARIGVTGALQSKTTTGGTFDAADITISAVSGATVEAVILYKHTGTESTSNLICFIDGLTLTPDGTDVTIAWNGSGIFAWTG